MVELDGAVEVIGVDGPVPFVDLIRELVLDDQRLRNDICWSVFVC